jgi:hypothetical protein
VNKTLSTVLVVVAILVLAGGLFFFGTMYGRRLAFGNAGSFGYNTGAWGPGMMAGRRGYGMMGGNAGMMGGGYGMMNGRGGYGMMNGYGYNQPAASPLTVEQARAAAQKYIAALNNDDLAVAEVMVFDNNAYVAIKETSTGRGAFELLVDSGSQVAYPEHGPNMMWNAKYGGLNHTRMMGGYGGMMGGAGPWGNYNWGSAPSTADAPMTVTAKQAVEYAQTYLDTALSGTVAADDPLEFYGYYTLDFTRDGKIAGMLSVNGYTGQVFLHTWHGNFIEEAE